MSNIAVFRQQALKLVNERRLLHVAPQLTHSPELEESAQTWAEALASKAALENSVEARQGLYGESISQRTSTSAKIDITADEVVTQWYSEMVNYDFKEGAGKAGNFTQMVWLASRQVGFGKAHADGKVVVVAHYNPPGNIRGRYANFVNPLINSDLEATQLVGELAGFKVTMREVLRDEEFESGRPVVVEKEKITLEDAKGNVKEKVIERRFPKSNAGGAQKPAEKADTQESEDRPGAVLYMKDKDLGKFAAKVLSQHNKHRARHGVKSLKLNPDLSTQAQKFAELLSGKSKLFNSGSLYKGDRLGENIASRWSNGMTDYDGEEVVDHWYSESEKFTYGDEPSNIKGIGNFTQLVWKDSRELGVGKAIHKGSDGSHKVVVVCYYFPSGNVVPNFRENVQPPSK